LKPESSGLNNKINLHSNSTGRRNGTFLDSTKNRNNGSKNLILINEADQNNTFVHESLLNNIAESVLHLDEKCRILWANETVVKSLNLSLQDIFGKYCYEIRFGIGQHCHGCPVKQSLITSEINSGEVMSSDGRNWAVTSYPVVKENNKCKSVFEICKDITERKKTEDAILENERRWQFALEATSDSVWDWDLQSNIFNYFRRVKEKEGYFIEETKYDYHEWKKLIHSEDVKRTENKLEKHILGEIPIYENEHRIKGKTGNYSWIQDRGKIISWSADGKPLRMLGTHRDISEKKVAEEQFKMHTKQMFVRQAVLLELAKLDKSNFELSVRKICKTDARILDIERVSYWTFNEDKTELTCTLLYNMNSDTYTAGFKLRADQAPKYFTALNEDKVITVFNTYNDERTSELSELYLRPNNIISLLNFPVWVQDRMVGIVSHEQTGEKIRQWTFEEQEFCKSIVDMIALSLVTSERAKAEKEITRLSRAIEQSPASVIITDIHGNIEYVNPKFTEVTGYNFEEVIYRNPRLLKSGEMDPECYKILWDTISSGKEWRGEFLNKKKNGQLFWESASISPIKNSKGDTINYLAVKEDITEKKFMDIELKRALDRAEESSKLKTSLLANMSHELRTPLNGILGFAQLLSEEISDPVQKQMIQKIRQSGNRLMRTLNTILDLTEIESNEFLLSMTHMKIGTMLPYLLKEYEEKAKEKGLYWEYEIENKNDLTFTDESVFKKIIANLADNALKFTIIGGIKIKIDNEKRNAEGVFTKIHVIDSGIGIAEKNKELIFHEFRQASEGISRNFEGSGLGLTLARKMSRLLNGDIVVDSRLGVGSDFTLVLPAVTEEETDKVLKQETDTVQTFKEPISSYPVEVLLVEDNLINKEVVEVFLRGICRIDHAIDGEEAIKMTLAKKYALILMDINLGAGMTGVDVVKEIRKIPDYKSIPIVAITGYAMSGDKEKFLNEGMTHYISKPFDKQVLIRLINEIIYKK
jgi:PAS domain S-box-containing protein